MIRDTVEYKAMTPYLACAIAEGFCEGEDATEEQKAAAWQYIYDTGLWQQLQGWYGRVIFDTLIPAGLIDA